MERFYFTEAWKNDIRIFSLNRPIFFGINTDHIILSRNLTVFYTSEFLKKLNPIWNYDFVLYIINEINENGDKCIRIDQNFNISKYYDINDLEKILNADEKKVIIDFREDWEFPNIKSFNLSKKLEFILLSNYDVGVYESMPLKQRKFHVPKGVVTGKEEDINYYFINWYKIPKNGEGIQYEQVGVSSIELDKDSEFLDVREFTKKYNLEKIRQNIYTYEKKLKYIQVIISRFRNIRDDKDYIIDFDKQFNESEELLKLLPTPKIVKILKKLGINSEVVDEKRIKILI